MILLLNGAFGVGKTTVARLLVARIEGAVIYDPESWGYLLQQLPPWILGRANRLEDYQDLGLWRQMIARGIRRRHRTASPVIVPMAFTDATYFTELTKALATEAQVEALCLVAPIEIVTERLERRAQLAGRSVSEFERRRSRECVAAHFSPVFGRAVDATRVAGQVAGEIADFLRRADAAA
ncbi:AAA family ATPase [Phenylobacterium sp.]|uniref:AAA family ATPase n=1 Tax=Phenylobacterium sp. TaxID=1871053 RepID=UPI00374D2B0F